MRVGIIGGGLCGLSAAIRLAQRDIQIDIFEAAPTPGGRTRSFFEPRIGQWVDNGPHLMSGAYQHTMELLDEAGVGSHITWQKTLQLALWNAQYGHFHLQPSPALPLALALPLSCFRMPGHGFSDILSMLRLARHLNSPIENDICVQAWLHQIGINRALIRDMLEPLCLGAMNEPLATANAASFARVLREAFANHAAARLGWFNKPLSEALIDPLIKLARQRGVQLHSNSRIRSVQTNSTGIDILTANKTHACDAAIVALPLRAAHRLLDIHEPVRTQRITNIHMWFDDMPALACPFIGGIGTSGHWFFDVSAQMRSSADGEYKHLRHICCVISADLQALHGQALVDKVTAELNGIVGTVKKPQFVRIVSEHHATTSVSIRTQQASLPAKLINACEAPSPGDLPATIESAVQRGQKAAERCCLQLFS